MNTQKLYEQWKEQANSELIKMGHKPENCEVCENGSVYFGNMAFTESNYVTSFEDYIEQNK